MCIRDSLRAVRVRAESGIITDRFDIRKPIDLEVEFDVVKAGHIFVPVFKDVYKRQPLPSGHPPH